METDLEVGLPDRNGKREVVVAVGDEVHRDRIDVLSAYQRQAWRERVVYQLGYENDDGVHEWLESTLMAKAEAATERLASSAPVLKTLADVQATEVEWLWPGRIPLGRLSLWSGPPGIGKTFAAADAASRTSTGTPWCDGSECVRGDVIVINAEDDPSDTLRPRMEAHRADHSRIHILTGVERGDERDAVFTLADVDALEQAINQYPECRLVIVDPIGSYLGAERDSYRDNEVRSILAPVAAVAQRTDAAIVMVAHTRKAAAKSADDTVLGSRAFVGIARTVWHFAADPDDKNRRLMLPGKNNLAAQQTGLAFDIGGEPPRVRWERDGVEMHADDVMGDAASSQGTKLGVAKETITGVLEGGPRGEREVWGACEDAGVSFSTYKRARREMGVESEKAAFAGEWLLSLPNGEGAQASA